MLNYLTAQKDEIILWQFILLSPVPYDISFHSNDFQIALLHDYFKSFFVNVLVSII